MQANLGITDKAIRVISALVIAILFLSGLITGKPAAAFLIISGYMVYTAITGICVIYIAIGVDTYVNEPTDSIEKFN